MSRLISNPSSVTYVLNSDTSSPATSSPAKLDLVDQFADLTGDGLLPVGQGVNMGIDARVRDAM